MILLKNNEAIPADLIFLASSYEDGSCYIETSSLDGEKNLKKRSLPGNFTPPFTVPTVGGIPKEIRYPKVANIHREAPQKDLYKFQGKFELNGESNPLSIKQLLLKGAFLRNTDWVLAVVVYTGIESKIMLNSQKRHQKQSRIEGILNILVIVILCLQLIIALILSMLALSFFDNSEDDHLYLDHNYSRGSYIVISFFAYFLLVNTLIPISLTVTLEVIKVGLALYIMWDVEMYSFWKEGKKAGVSSASIVEELGQVHYIFSDKTGTLTRNEMVFKRSLVNGKEYEGKDIIIQNLRDHSQEGIYLEDFFTAIALCHEGLVNKELIGEVKEEIEDSPIRNFVEVQMTELRPSPKHERKSPIEASVDDYKYSYQSESPDEIALLNFANQIGIQFIQGSETEVKLNHKHRNNRLDNYHVLRRCEFNSDRKRMSVLVRREDIPGRYTLYMKGADSIMKKRLDMHSQHNANSLESAQVFLDNSAAVGLRTLLVAQKHLTEREAEDWLEKLNQADLSEDRENLIPQLYSEMEDNMELIGCTAVQDRLQDRVPETIQELQDAGIHIWMLTGDKLETAINIAKSCRLIRPGMRVLAVQGDDSQEIMRTLNSEIDILEQYYEKVDSLPKNLNTAVLRRAIVVEAVALDQIIKRVELRFLFLMLVAGAEAVVCCRVSPSQKADMVRMIKKTDKSITTLAIGDGANDVSMIMEAHIGIGLYGNEGMQSVQASDFALAQFQHLRRLLLHHGRLAYFRVSELILYFFYKNIVFTLPQAYYAFVCAFSAQTVFDDWYISLYNTIFTAVPLVAKAIYEVDVHGRLGSDKAKDLYYIGQNEAIFNCNRYLKWVLQGLVHSIIVFAIPFYILEQGIIREDGINGDLWNFSVASFTTIFLIVTLKMMIFIRVYNWIHWVAIGVTSCGFYFTYVILSNYFSFSKTHLSIEVILSTPLFYLTVLFTAGAPIFFDFFLTQAYNLWWQSPAEYLRLKFGEKRGQFWARVRRQGMELANQRQIIKSPSSSGQSSPRRDTFWPPGFNFTLTQEEEARLQEIKKKHKARVEARYKKNKLRGKIFGQVVGKCCCKGRAYVLKRAHSDRDLSSRNLDGSPQHHPIHPILPELEEPSKKNSTKRASYKDRYQPPIKIVTIPSEQTPKLRGAQNNFEENRADDLIQIKSARSAAQSKD